MLNPIHNMAWKDYNASFCDRSKGHFELRLMPIRDVSIRVNELSSHLGPELCVNLDPVVLPYLAQVCLMLKWGTHSMLHRLCQEIHPGFQPGKLERKDLAREFCLGVVSNLDKERLTEPVLRNVIVRDRVVTHFYAVDERILNTPFLYALQGEVENWRLSAFQQAVKAASLPDFGQSCQAQFARYREHQNGIINRSSEELDGEHLVLPDPNVLKEIEGHLSLQTPGEHESFLHYSSQEMHKLQMRDFRLVDLPYTAFYPSHYAIERHVLKHATFDRNCMDAARARVLALFGLAGVSTDWLYDFIMKA